MNIPILKCHGSGNDFILIDELETLRIAEQHRSSFTRDICDRHTSFGADGALFLLPATDSRAHCMMRMFNPDGSEAKMCGNGLRCLARYYCETHDTKKICVQTADSLHICTRESSHHDVHFYKVDIGPVNFSPASLHMQREHALVDEVITELHPTLRWHALSITNPHLLAVTTEQTVDIEQIGRKANTLPLFALGVNCSLIKPLAKNRLFVTTWERGVGLTSACGTAMSASCFVAVYSKLCEKNTPVEISNNGATVFCTASGRVGEMVSLSGNATFVYSSSCEYNSKSGKLAGEAENYNTLLQRQ